MQDTAAPLINFACVEKLDSAPDSYPIGLFDDLEKAKGFLADFRWVLSIEEEYLGGFYPEIIGIFLFKFTPKLVGVDDFVWVIVGEVPSAYITVEECPNPATALDGYIGAMEEWVEAVLNSEPTGGLIPVNESETKENALVLIRRLKYLNDLILPDCKGSLEEDRRQ
ncbi:hypothetical protein [Roseovarius aestuarii]|uniref:Uncharacterized protein n=1 Tax=Roseovarius aestuarii TaxID=475083 RepID=A0A1X7BQP7_9RHOB|nr:hypothetical protein [Roseovarius aestuarii]SMC11952.1 hypothetical protein ROA7745_01773 [Roseovarius aestuarii]